MALRLKLGEMEGIYEVIILLDVKRQGHGIGNECKNKVLGTDMK
jgi:hypothetical protein